MARRADRRAMRERIGYMPEERGLYPKMRVGDQLEYFAVLHGARTRRGGLLRARGWTGSGSAIASGARVEELSQGNQQRVQLAAALVHDPDLLILDEPFAGLDPIVTDLLAEVLREEAARGVPVLFSSHQLELVEQSVRVGGDHRSAAGWLRVGRSMSCGPAALGLSASTLRARRRIGSTRSLMSSWWSARAGGTS